MNEEKKLCIHCSTMLLPTQESFCCFGCRAAHEFINNLNLGDYYKFCKEIYNSIPPKIEEFDSHINYREYCEDVDEKDEIAIDHTTTNNKPNEAVNLNTKIYKKIFLMVDGIHCGSCIWLIETALERMKGILFARINLSTRRLKIIWQDTITPDLAIVSDFRLNNSISEDGVTIEEITSTIKKLGYRPLPYIANQQEDQRKEYQRYLLKCLAIAGFVWGQNMMITMAIWSGNWTNDFGDYTRYLLNIFALMITIPGICYSAMPFFRSALQAVKHGHSNMDVPISVSIIVILILSAQEMMRNTVMTYYEAASSLVFALLAGRYLEYKVRNKALQYARSMILSQPSFVYIVENNGHITLISAKKVQPGDVVLVASGDRIGVDGVVISGFSEVDNSIITGESVPITAKIGDYVWAGSTNLGNPIKIRASKSAGNTILAEIIALIEKAEQNKARYRGVADKVASLYTPIVFIASMATCIVWMILGASILDSVRNAMSVMIITCPCAMGLAVPMVQIIISNNLMKRGILIKTSQGLERLAEVDTIIFDKTGTLTYGRMNFINGEVVPAELTPCLLALAGSSRHPVCKAIVRCLAESGITGDSIVLDGVKEESGMGISAMIDVRAVKGGYCDGVSKYGIGSVNISLYRPNASIMHTAEGEEYSMANSYEKQAKQMDLEEISGARSIESVSFTETIFTYGDQHYRLFFSDKLRDDAKDMIKSLRTQGYNRFAIISGDSKASVEQTGAALSIDELYWRMMPKQKHDFIAKLQGGYEDIDEDKERKNKGRVQSKYMDGIEKPQAKAKAHNVLMVGDGLNDSAALKIAHASISLATAIEISQNQADVLVQNSISHVALVLLQAKKGVRLIKQNFIISALYNVISIPIAAMGMTTPVYAAVFMAVSSVLVIMNALRGNS